MFDCFVDESRSEATMSQTSDGRRMATIHFIIHDAMIFPIIFADR